MKMLLGVMALAGLMLMVGGCATLADTPNDNAIRIQHAQYTNLMQVPDDLEHIAYIERPIWMSRLPVPND